jgi:hypothetical protein
MTNPKDLKTIGLTPFSYHANEPLFRINAGVPVIAALSHVSDLLHVAKLLASTRPWFATPTGTPGHRITCRI